MTAQDQALRDAIGQLEGARDVMTKLAGLFSAISKLGNDDTAALASIGKYIADDWDNLLDVDIEGFSSQLRGGAQ